MAASFKDQIRCGTTCQRDSTPTESRFQVESYEDVTVALPLELDPKAQRVFAYLPVRSVGFKFAIQAPFHLTASRADLHRSPENLRRRNCVAKAFIKACAWDEFLFKFNGIHLFYQSTVLLMSTSKGLKPFHPKALFNPFHGPFHLNSGSNRFGECPKTGTASFDCASRALDYLGTEPAELFWLPVRQQILEDLRNLVGGPRFRAVSSLKACA